MTSRAISDGPVRRPGEELDEDGIVLDVDADVRALVLDELDHARRVPVFEGRRRVYGSFVIPTDRALLQTNESFDLVDLSVLDIGSARAYADGWSAYLVRHPDATPELACFERLLQYEVELVRLQENTGAQRIASEAERFFGCLRWSNLAGTDERADGQDLAPTYFSSTRITRVSVTTPSRSSASAAAGV